MSELNEQELVARLPMGIAIFDKEFRYVYMNKAAEELYKIPKEEVLGRNLWEVFPNLVGTEVYEVYERTMRERVPGRMEFYYEPWQSWFDIKTDPMAGEGIVVYFQSNAERKLVEKQLVEVSAASRKQQRLYSTLLNHTPDFAYVWSLDHKFIYANKALTELYGISGEEIVGRGFRDVGYAEWHARMHEDEIDQVARTGKPLRGIIPFTGKSGGGVYDYIFIPVFDADGAVEAVAGTTRDITELRNANEALEENDRRKNEFLSILAHELRNPLSPLLNGLELLSVDMPEQEHAGIRKMMHRQLVHLKHLVDDLMEVSRINRGAVKMRMAGLDLSDVLEHVTEVMGPQVRKLGHDLTIRIEHDLAVTGDRTRLVQIFMNLLENACKYTPPGGKITLEAVRSGDEVVVQVKDTGMGILPEDVDAVFTMFKKVERDDGPKQGGLGIGLSLAKELVQIHEGDISVHSAGKNEGSTFTVRLPLRNGPPEVDEAGENREPRRGMKVLVVDDNKDAADSLVSMLRNLGQQARVAYSGEDALAMVDDLEPQLIFLDLGMPRINGFDTCIQLRRMSSARDARIIALSGWGQTEVRERTKASGFDGHQVKPLEKDDLLKLLSV